MFDVILADPPWRFESWQSDKAKRKPERYYNTMTLDDIKAMQIPAADNCALFMWAVWPAMPEAFEVINAWGFRYRTIGWVWVKAKSNGFGFHMGLGDYARANTEPCLFAVRGSMPVARHDIQALIYSPVRQHSRKPDEQYPKIEKLYPGKRYLEMFARRTRPGWQVFGNQVEGSIRLPNNCVNTDKGEGSPLGALSTPQDLSDLVGLP